MLFLRLRFCVWASLLTWGLAIGAVESSLQAGLVTNPEFGDYGVLEVPTALNSLPPLGWSELGAGGANLVYNSFGAYSSAAADNCVLLTTVGDGIRQKILGTVSGQTYIVEGYYGQTQEWYKPTVRTSVFNGNSVAPSDLITSYDYTLDADMYGDGVLSSNYVGFFVAQSSTTTLLFTLVARTDGNDPGAILDFVSVVPYPTVPEPTSLGLLTIGLALGVVKRSRKSLGRRG
ncbi:MAG TPA: hypothetical protein DDY91_23820 [Planctomycetaceae bacterium]|nr:hypothetical protein [Planctomycetaceae bacterium]